MEYPTIQSALHDEEQLEEGITLFSIPPHMHNAIRGYVLDHRPVGGFLSSVLRNDLTTAAFTADAENEIALGRWAKFIYNHVPSGCHGSPEKVKAWLKDFPKKERISNVARG